MLPRNISGAGDDRRPVEPRVSVVVPSYRHSRFIAECLESALSQTMGDLEIVVIDDASPDDSVEAIRRLRDPRIKLFVNEQNLGTYATQNRGVDLAASPTIAILNSDDVWLPEKLERQLDTWAKHPEASFCYTFGRRIGTKVDAGAPEPQDTLPTTPVQMLAGQLVYDNPIFASSVLFRRGSLRFDPTLRYSGDWAALLSLVRHGPAACVPEPLVRYREHEGNTYRDRPGTVLEEVRVRRTILEHPDWWMSAGGDPDFIRRQLVYCALRLHAAAVLGRDREMADWALARAENLAPGNRQVRKRRMAKLLPERLFLRRLGPGEDVEQIRQHYRSADAGPVAIP